MDPQNNRYWCAENAMFIHQKSLHDINGGVWYAMSATSTTGPIFFTQDHKITLVFYTNSDAIFKHLFNYKTTYAILQKDSATAYTANNSLLVTE